MRLDVCSNVKVHSGDSVWLAVAIAKQKAGALQEEHKRNAFRTSAGPPSSNSGALIPFPDSLHPKGWHACINEKVRTLHP